MKKYFLGLVLFSVITISFSCKSGGGGSSPTAAMKAMASDVKSGDFTVIGKHLCKADKEMFDKWMPMVESMAKMMGKDMKTAMKEQMEKEGKFNYNDVEFTNEKIDGDKATLVVVNKKENKSETINFTKEGGEWKMCIGIADKANEAFKNNGVNDPNAPKNMDEVLEKMKDPKVQEQMKKAQEMIKNMKPEEIEKYKKITEQMEKMSKH